MRLPASLKISRTQRQLLRIAASIGLAIAILLLVQAELLLFAVILAIISKWQVTLGGPRLWLHNIWDNATDIIVLWSYIALLSAYVADSTVQWLIVGLYLLWQLFIKPMEGESGRGVQALFALGIGVGTIFLYKGLLGIAVLMGLCWLVANAAADHFLVGSDDPARRLLSFIWALIVAQCAWIFSHWLILYPFFNGRVLVPQAAVVTVALGYVFGNIYRDHAQKRLGKKRLYGYLAFIGLVVVGLIAGSEWMTEL